MIRLLMIFLTISYAHADILEREDVQNFIELAVNSSELTKQEVENYLIKAMPSEKAQTARPVSYTHLTLPTIVSV